MNRSNSNQFILPMQLRDKYTVLNKIGAGNSSIVWLCLDKDSGEQFVVKIINKTGHIDRMNEVNILKQLDHPNIIKYITHEDTPTKLYLVTEYVKGETLEEVRTRARISSRDAAFIMVQLMDGLSYLHNLGIVHRDITPTNLFVQFVDNKVSLLKIGDFGLSAKLINGIQVGSYGTVEYAAPEMGGVVHNKKVDIYSSGMVLQAIAIPMNMLDSLLLGRTNFHELDIPDPELCDLVNKMTEVNPVYRYSVADVLNHTWIQTFSQRE